jgi:hypothetical protein
MILFVLIKLLNNVRGIECSSSETNTLSAEYFRYSNYEKCSIMHLEIGATSGDYYFYYQLYDATYYYDLALK